MNASVSDLRNGRSRPHLVFGITGAQGVPGGIAKANFNVMQALSDLVTECGGRLTILSLLECDEDRPSFLPSSVEFKSFKGNQRDFGVNLFRNLTSATLYCFDHVSLSLPLLPLAATKIARTVIFNHGSESWKRIQRMNRLSIRYATKCLTNSHWTLKKMREHIGEFKGAACPLGLPPDFPLSTQIFERNGSQLQLQAVDGETYSIGNRMLLMVARMLPTERQKGHTLLLSVMPDLLRDYPDAQLVLAGDGADRQSFADHAKKIGIASSVFLPGFLSVERLQALYQHCFSYVMPSLEEGFGIAYLEAMNYGKPCIGCFDQGTEDVIVDNETGFLIHGQDNPGELIAAIRKLLGNSRLATKLGGNGFNRLHQQFTAAHHQARVKTEISRLLTKTESN